MVILILFGCGCLSGFVLFRKNILPSGDGSYRKKGKLSVIIPARNEEENLPTILASLKEQTCQPDEIIVVDDFSEDRTKAVAKSYGAQVVENASLPEGWTGKTWAVWNGFLHSSGEVLAFLDADVHLAPRALASLLAAREKAGGAISVVPYHHTEKFYERFALIPNILGVFAFTSFFEKKNPEKGLYGSCIVTTREDYEKVNGHDSIKSELLDDLNLGARYMEAGTPVQNFIGRGLVSFRMYPHGIKSEIQGFGKGAVLSTATLTVPTIILIAIWVIGLLVSASFVVFLATPWAVPLLIGYILYLLQIFYLVRSVGRFGWLMPVLHILSALFFIFVMVYSAYQVMVLGHVSWKGRHIEVGGKKH